MATFTKPIKIPRWADTGTIVEPSEPQKDSGWTFQQVPPSSMENWKENLTGQWFKWIDERMNDGGTADTFVLRNPAAANDFFAVSRTADVISINFSGSNDLVFDVTAASEFFDIRVAGATASTRHRSDRVNVPGALVVGSADGAGIAAGVISASVGFNLGGTVTPRAGVGIATEALVVGTDLDYPDLFDSDEGIIINDINFRIHGGGTTFPTFAFDSLDSLTYDRNNDRLILSIASNTWGFDSTSITPFSIGTRDLGTPTFYLNELNAERFTPRGSTVEDPVNTRFEYGKANLPTLLAKLNSTTAAVIGTSWNVASTSKPATGRYVITPTEAVSSDSVIVSAVTLGIGRWATAFVTGGTVEINVWLDNATLSDSPPSVVVYG